MTIHNLAFSVLIKLVRLQAGILSSASLADRIKARFQVDCAQSIKQNFSRLPENFKFSGCKSLQEASTDDGMRSMVFKL